MFYIIGIVILILLLPLLFTVLAYVIGFVVIVGLIVLCFKYPMIGIPIVVSLIIFGKMDSIKLKWGNIVKISKWKRKKGRELTAGQLEDFLLEKMDSIVVSDDNATDYRFKSEEIPYGRANAYLNLVNSSIQEEDIYYFSPCKSLELREIREYGLLITNKNLYLTSPHQNRPKRKIIPYQQLVNVSYNPNSSILSYELYKQKDNVITSNFISKGDTTVPLSAIYSFLSEIIDNEIPQSIYGEKIISQQDVLEKVENVSIQQRARMKFNATDAQISQVTSISSMPQYIEQYNELRNYMNGARGSGYAAEYGNNTVDKALGKKVLNAAQNLENGRQIKHGADRIVNGVEIQTKYYKTASESVVAAFRNDNALYIKTDGSGQMMQIEVPRDQYIEAVKLMQKRIDAGEVPKVKPGEDAHNYVRKGHFTYAQSFNIAQSGTIESLTIDSLNGAVISVYGASISATIVFATAVWQGRDIKDAAKASLYAGMKTLGTGTMIYALTMQLSRDKIANPFIKLYTKDGIYQGFSSINNPIFAISESVAKSISNSTVAKSSFGSAIGLDQVKGKVLVSNAIVAVVVFGPDICKVVSGKISSKQFFKNTSVGAAGLGGAFIGNLLVPVVGGIVGGIASSIIAKKTLDKYIEEDSNYMFQILKEEFLDVTMQAGLTKIEFDFVVEETIGHKKLSKILENMYQSDEYRYYAKVAIVEPVVQQVFSKRESISNNIIEASYFEVIEEVVEKNIQIAS